MSIVVDQTVQEVTQKSAIGVAGVTYTLFGLPFDQVAAIATAVYMLFSAILLIPKLIDMVSNIKSERKTKNESLGKGSGDG
jgi:uncharacterized membrane protein